MIQRLALLSLAGCSILGTADSSDSSVTRGTVHIIAFTDEGAPADGADVLVHDAYGQLAARGKVSPDGTADVDSVANATAPPSASRSSCSSIPRSRRTEARRTGPMFAVSASDYRSLAG
jgi:hypothetical protein